MRGSNHSRRVLPNRVADTLSGVRNDIVAIDARRSMTTAREKNRGFFTIFS
jgi:hypothetical protein